MSKKTWIISAFPCMGKSHYVQNNPDTSIDIDSFDFSWFDADVTRNPNFPSNYISHIKGNIGKYKYIMVSSHKVVRQALIDEGLTFIYVCPGNGLKDEFIQRARSRGSSNDFIRTLEVNWDSWLDHNECSSMTFVTCQGQYLTDVLETLEGFIR